MAAIEFPRALLREKSHAWNMAGAAVAGGPAIAGTGTLTRSDGGGYWTCQMSDIALAGRAGMLDRGRDRQRKSTLLWRAIRQIAGGGVNSLVVPRNDARFRPWPAGLPQGAAAIIPHSDTSLFVDGAGYYQSVIDIIAGGDADLRDTELDIVVNYAGELIGGESFSIEHPTWGWRMYEIATVEMASNSEGTITFNPPLREDVAVGTRLEFDRPRCLMRLAQPSSMNLTVQPWTFNNASVDFVEAPIT
ncbi:hypothetical protein [Bradyrhizobium cosmicum]|uniref:Uncharacterized protein n=1 Tax=Bradyrhizobium cosmicum TaxID=1404864 RepID=A0AAI8MCP4_9BRAD|nr:hypothetical protein [Bradyrhizobium cosmicum]BAL76009.1 hypothetical protein S23_27970 [Bradyrhizobium cosmicum]